MLKKDTEQQLIRQTFRDAKSFASDTTGLKECTRILSKETKTPNKEEIRIPKHTHPRGK